MGADFLDRDAAGAGRGGFNDGLKEGAVWAVAGAPRLGEVFPQEVQRHFAVGQDVEVGRGNEGAGANSDENGAELATGNVSLFGW